VADPGLTMVVYTPEAGSKSEQALSLLGSLAGAIPWRPGRRRAV
jgi:hypothetical protein